MEAVVIRAAQWVVGKALAPVTDGLLEAWAASKKLGPNVLALKTELLCTQATLDSTRGWEIDNQALNDLLQKLRDLAYNAEDVLDELDYFRFQDELEGAYEAADEHAKGCVCNLFLNAHHTAKAVGKLLWFPACSCATSPGDPREPREEDARQQVLCCACRAELGPPRRRSALDNTSSLPHSNQTNEKVSGCMRKLASGARSTIRDVGNRLHCSSLPFVHDDDDDSSMSVLCDACMRKAPQGKHAKETPKLEFNRVDLSKRMEHIVKQLQPERAKVTTILNIELLGATRSIAKSRRSTTSDIDEREMYGREPAKKDIIDSITHGKYCGEDLTILPIVGPGGIGKTTLVQHIYHSQEVQNHFEVRVWNCVSQNFNVNKLIEMIKNSIPPVEGEKENATVRELIEQRLKSKRFLLILDDIWKCEYEDWKRLLVPLTKGQAKGNIILVTTRFPAVVEMVKSKTTQSSIDLEGLDREAFRELFLACVFGDQESRNAHPELIETGDKIQEKLKGNPLAAKTVGKLLGNDLDRKHWTRVLESREWEMQTGDHDIMPALKLSYDYLPFYLQQCFSYCALFPEDHEFDSKELIHFWIGQDILRYGGQNKSIEDIGLSNLNELVTHGFFKKDETHGRPCYLIHDLLHDLSLIVASHECVSVARSNVRSVQIQSSVRHLSIIMDNADDNDGMTDDNDGMTNDNDGMTDENFRMELKKLKKRLKVENLQTLMIFGELDESFADLFGDLFGKANALRVLSLPQMPYPVESMLHNFSKLVHLRYLRLMTWFGSRVHLPSTISRFYHLRILDLPNLYFGTQDRHDLPRGMSNLVKLRHFLTEGDEVHSAISNVGKLQFLQELRKFQVNKENNGFELKQLEHLIELTELGIYNLEKIHTKEEAAEAKLVDKNHLLKLTLEWESNGEPDSEALVLESLRPQNNLEELRIRGHGGPSCPLWLGHELSVKALKSLHLVGVAWKILPPLGQMWVLQELTLKDVAALNEFGPSQFGRITEHSFHHLKRLKLIGLIGLKKWVVGDACHLFSGLHVLTIRDCPKLSELPFMNNICYPPKHDENIHWLPNLQKFKIEGCPKVLTLPPIPWTPTLCSVMITNSLCYSLVRLVYSKSSSEVSLHIDGTNNLRSLDEVVSFNCLTELRVLNVSRCPTVESKHLPVLTSLKTVILHNGSTNVFVPSGSLGDVEWQLPIEHLEIQDCTDSGKELTQLLSHLPKLAKLRIRHCEKITRMGVEVEQQQRTGPVSWPSSSAVKMEDTQATDQQQQIAEGVEEEEQDEEDGLLLFPAHNSLRDLYIGSDCRELILVASPPLLPNGHKAGGIDGVGGLQALRSLQRLSIWNCRKLLSAYSSSSCCPFPSSLQDLELGGVKGMETLEPLSNLTSLTRLRMQGCGEDLRGEGLWHLLTRGQLSELIVQRIPKFFAFQTIGDKEQQPPKLSKLTTDDVAGVLAAPICSLLSSSLTDLHFERDKEVERFTKEQEEALHLLTSLQDLQFTCCVKLQSLPAGLHRLTSLKRLRIVCCQAIRSLPKDDFDFLRSLRLFDNHSGSEELTRQCRELTGTTPIIRA